MDIVNEIKNTYYTFSIYYKRIQQCWVFFQKGSGDGVLSIDLSDDGVLRKELGGDSPRFLK